MLNEGQIKAAIIDRLFATGALDDAVLINEMVVANWSRRVDLAVANGRLHAFEVKSDLDTLRRLPGQLSTYLDRFDKVTIVTTSRFAKIIRDMTDDCVEIWEASETSEGVALKIIRRGRSADVVNRRVLCGFLHKPELVSYLTSNKIFANTDMPREILVNLTESTSVRAMRKFVLSALKVRYKETFERFQEVRLSHTKIDDLIGLSKSKLRLDRTPPKLTAIPSPKSHGNARQINLQALAKKYGPLPDTMPTMVLRKVPIV